MGTATDVLAAEVLVDEDLAALAQEGKIDKKGDVEEHVTAEDHGTGGEPQGGVNGGA